MDKFIKFLAATTALCSCSFAQDILIGCNGEMKRGFVVSIQADKIIYKTDKNETALYSVRRDEVLTVIFENGQQQVFECQQVQTPPQTGAIVTVEANIPANGSPNAVAKIADVAAVAAVNQASDIAKAGINNAAQNITGNIAGGKLGGLAKGGLKGAAQSIGNAAANAAVNQAVDIVQTINNVARNDTQSYLFLAFRYMLLSPIAEGSGIMQGYEYEIGGFKRNKFLFTGTTFFAHGLNSDDDLNIGLGGGIFISPILQRDAVKLIPGFNLGFWIYTYDSYYYNDNYYYNDEILYAYEFMWGGPDIRLMLGRTGFFEIFYKMQFGMRYENERGYDYSSYYKFNVKFLWGVGISFSIKGTAGCQCE